MAFEASLGSTCRLCGAWQGAFGLEPIVQMYVDHTVEILRELRRVLRDDGVVFLNLGDSYGKTSKSLRLVPERVAIAAEDDGWIVRDIIIWHKRNPVPESVKDRCTRSYEPILMLTKQKKYYFDCDAIAEPADSAEHRGKLPPIGNKKHIALGKANLVGNRIPPKKTRNKRNVWTIATEPHKDAHIAMFPSELPCLCILAASRPGDVVLDPFGGSGTTTMVAVALGRHAVSLDLAYQDIAREKIAAGCRQTNNREESLAEPLSVTVDQGEGSGAALQGAEVPVPGITDSMRVFREDSRWAGMPSSGCGKIVQADWR
jgi:site-specific DNA-methyltransferase (adenine-specific)